MDESDSELFQLAKPEPLSRLGLRLLHWQAEIHPEGFAALRQQHSQGSSSTSCLGSGSSRRGHCAPVRSHAPRLKFMASFPSVRAGPARGSQRCFCAEKRHVFWDPSAGRRGAWGCVPFRLEKLRDLSRRQKQCDSALPEYPCQRPRSSNASNGRHSSNSLSLLHSVR